MVTLAEGWIATGLSHVQRVLPDTNWFSQSQIAPVSSDTFVRMLATTTVSCWQLCGAHGQIAIPARVAIDVAASLMALKARLILSQSLAAVAEAGLLPENADVIGIIRVARLESMQRALAYPLQTFCKWRSAFLIKEAGRSRNLPRQRLRSAAAFAGRLCRAEFAKLPVRWALSECLCGRFLRRRRLRVAQRRVLCVIRRQAISQRTRGLSSGWH
mmetsp:Transcript_71137/g.129822  ORF Transcript_71137/g.129822 Transcript_71137/m.129822 type:complete len:215 (+) Transcript_71137:552-1196(+)